MGRDILGLKQWLWLLWWLKGPWNPWLSSAFYAVILDAVVILNSGCNELNSQMVATSPLGSV
jgi:hypothetical protein